MNNYNELKLAVYESGLGEDDITEIIDVMESCDEEELQEVCEEVVDLLNTVNAEAVTESKGNAVSRIQDIKARASYNAKADRSNANIKNEIDNIYDKIAELRSHIQKGRPADAAKIRGEISDYQDRITELKSSISKNNQKRNAVSSYRQMQKNLTKSYAREKDGSKDFDYGDDAADRFVRKTSKDTKEKYYK